MQLSRAVGSCSWVVQLGRAVGSCSWVVQLGRAVGSCSWVVQLSRAQLSRAAESSTRCRCSTALQVICKLISVHSL